jgi:hypothetical protein
MSSILLEGVEPMADPSGATAGTLAGTSHACRILVHTMLSGFVFGEQILDHPALVSSRTKVVADDTVVSSVYYGA